MAHLPYCAVYWQSYSCSEIREMTSDDKNLKQDKLWIAINAGLSTVFQFWLILLNALFASTIKKYKFHVVKISSQIAWNLWTAPSITTLSWAHKWSSWHAMVAYGTVTFSTILAKICLHVYPTLTVIMPFFLSSAIRWKDINSRWHRRELFVQMFPI